jgi:hypothetical protein
MRGKERFIAETGCVAEQKLKSLLRTTVPNFDLETVQNNSTLNRHTS